MLLEDNLTPLDKHKLSTPSFVGLVDRGPWTLDAVHRNALGQYQIFVFTIDSVFKQLIPVGDEEASNDFDS